MRRTLGLALLTPLALLACDPRGSGPPPARTSASAPSASTASAAPSAPGARPLASSEAASDELGDPLKGWPPGYTPPLVRERVELDFNDAKETWELRWKKPPEPACFTKEAKAMARCLGLGGPGEVGAIELVRKKNGVELAAQDLTDVLGASGSVILPRFQGDPRFSAKGLTEAAPVKLLVLADVNQDGQAAEAVLVGRYQPYKERQAALVGFGPSTGKAFAFVAENAGIWERVRTLPRFDFVTVPCFDHGSPSEYVDVFRKGPHGMTRTQKRFACLENADGGARGKLEETSEETPLGL